MYIYRHGSEPGTAQGKPYTVSPYCNVDWYIVLGVLRGKIYYTYVVDTGSKLALFEEGTVTTLVTSSQLWICEAVSDSRPSLPAA